MTPELRKAFNCLKTHASAVANFTLQWQDLEDHCNSIHKSIQSQLEIFQQKSQGQEKSPGTHLSPALESRVGPEETDTPSVLVSQGVCNETESIGGIDSNVKWAEVQTVSIQKHGVKLGETQVPSKEPKSDETQVSSKEHQSKEENNSSRVSVFDGIPIQNGKALLVYLNENSKHHDSIRTNICNALKASSQPVKLVLDAIKWFFPVGLNRKEMNFEDRDIKRSCVLLLEELENADPTIKPQETEEARTLALQWKVKTQAGLENSLHIAAFLHLLSTFGLAKNFDADEILRLCYICVQRRQATQLLRSLGLANRASDFIKHLISQNRQTEAVRFIYEFNLVDEFPPVPLLKAYYENAKKTAKDYRRAKPSQKDQTRGKEISALKAIITCIERYKLESEYPPNDLKNQIEQLRKQIIEPTVGPKNDVRQIGKKRPSSAMEADLYTQKRTNHQLSFAYKEAARSPTVYDALNVYTNQPFHRQPTSYLPDRDSPLVISSPRTSVPASTSYYASNRLSHLHPSSSISDHNALDLTTSSQILAYSNPNTQQMISSPGNYHSPNSAARYSSLTARYFESTGGTFENGLSSSVSRSYPSIPEEPSRVQNYNYVDRVAMYQSGYGKPSKPPPSIYHL